MEAFNVYNVFIAKPFQVLPSPWPVYGRAIANMKVIKNKSEPNPSYFHKGSRLWSKKVKCNRTFWKISCCSCAVTAKKCTKTCAARAGLLFCLLDLLLFCCPRRRRRRRLGCFNSVKALMSPRNTTTEVQAHPVAKFAANSSLDLP